MDLDNSSSIANISGRFEIIWRDMVKEIRGSLK